MEISGSCHCKNLHYRLDWPDDDDEIPMRMCGCTFCVKHSGAWTSHRDARLSVTVNDPAVLTQYRFGTKTADFYVCSRCGVVPMVVCEIDNELFAVVNVHTFDDSAKYRFSSTATDFDGEDTGSRLERRQRNWIPNVKLIQS